MNAVLVTPTPDPLTYSSTMEITDFAPVLDNSNHIDNHHWPLLLTWFNSTPSMDK